MTNSLLKKVGEVMKDLHARGQRFTCYIGELVHDGEGWYYLSGAKEVRGIDSQKLIEAGDTPALAIKYNNILCLCTSKDLPQAHYGRQCGPQQDEAVRSVAIRDKVYSHGALRIAA